MAVTALRLALDPNDARDSQRAEQIEQVFFAAGALSVVLTDQRDDPVLEPKPGEVRLWPATQLEALFDEQSPALTSEGLAVLAAACAYPVTSFEIAAIAERAWEREWLRDYRPLRFGERLWICPTHHRIDEPGAVIIQLDPGLAFGTGTHPTTRLCLEFLESLEVMPQRVIDYGCGSGILALAALKLGAQAAWVPKRSKPAPRMHSAMRSGRKCGPTPMQHACSPTRNLWVAYHWYSQIFWRHLWWIWRNLCPNC